MNGMYEILPKIVMLLEQYRKTLPEGKEQLEIDILLHKTINGYNNRLKSDIVKYLRKYAEETIYSEEATQADIFANVLDGI